jgi:5-methylcytosine-specific restriction endonuclease McrA
MRFIDLEELKPLIRHLLVSLQEAQQAVNQESDPERRADLIKRNRTRWVECRDALSKLSYDKCWYIECKNPGTDDDVDHFRPKSGVVEEGSHPGYYWLAFDWTNFRLSCHRANRPRKDSSTGETGGKAAHFPLVDPKGRAWNEDDDLSREVPALLDPTVLTDITMLTFKPDGDADLAPSHKGDSVAEFRFELSRQYLHLNWPTFREERVTLYNKIERTIDRGAKLAPYGPSGIHNMTEAFHNILKDLRRLMDPKSEYSMAARAYIESFGHEWWVRDIVLKA